jgi:hypothetical protein
MDRNLDTICGPAIGLVHGGRQFLANNSHFRRRFNANAHTAMTKLDHSDGNFVTDQNSLADFSTKNQHKMTLVGFRVARMGSGWLRLRLA